MAKTFGLFAYRAFTVYTRTLNHAYYHIRSEREEIRNGGARLTRVKDFNRVSLGERLNFKPVTTDIYHACILYVKG